MNRKYLTYSMEELLDDPAFISYVLHGHGRREWELLLTESHSFSMNVSKAREIINLLRDSYEYLPGKDVAKLWQKIDRYERMISVSRRRRLVYTVMRYAAVFLILIATGLGVWYYYNSDKDPLREFSFSQSADVPREGEARLILPGGDEILLGRDNSNVEVSKSGEIVINQEKIIDARQASAGKSAAMNEVLVPYGKKSQLLLADGTKVWLNAGSRMAFPSEFKGKRREVYVEGEAYFEVTHVASQPFFVQVRDITIKVLGTRFNLSAYSTDAFVETVLLEGSVSLTENKGNALARRETILKPYQKASFSKDSRHFSIDSVTDAELYTAWTSGWFRFSQDNLANVLRKLERYYDVEIVCGSDFTADGLISGKLDLKESLEQVMRALADVSGFEFTIQEGRVTVSKPLKMIPVKK